MESAPRHRPELLEKVTNLAKRRGFIFQSAEIYGGFRSTYDYGPLGVNMLRNVKQAVVANHGPTANRHRGARRGDPRSARGVGGVGPPGDLHRPAGRLSQVQGTLARGQDRRSLSQLRVDRVHRAAGLQSHVQDPGRARSRARARRRTCVPRPPRACSRTSPTCSRPCARSRPSASPRSASPSATRSPRRTSSFARGSSSRWRWSTSSPRPRPTSGTGTGSASASTGTSTSASPKRLAAPARARPGGPLALLARHDRRRVRLPVGLGRARGHREPR